jgi:hypothetical protein
VHRFNRNQQVESNDRNSVSVTISCLWQKLKLVETGCRQQQLHHIRERKEAGRKNAAPPGAPSGNTPVVFASSMDNVRREGALSRAIAPRQDFATSTMRGGW